MTRRDGAPVERCPGAPASPRSPGHGREAIFAALDRLDRLLAAASAAVPDVYGSEPTARRFRGLYVAETETRRLLDREPGTPLFAAAVHEHLDADDGRHPSGWLADTFRLTPFDLDVIVIGLAPEIDLRYERLFAYLQDDVTRRRPTVDLALNLLCASTEEKLERRSRFGADAPLVRHRLIDLVPDAHQVEPPLLGHYIRVDRQVIALLIDDRHLDERLAGVCERVVPQVGLDGLPLADETRRGLRALAHDWRRSGDPLTLYFRGPRATLTRQAAEAVAREACAELLAADIRRFPEPLDSFQQRLDLLAREALFRGAAIYLEGLDGLAGDDGRRRALTTALGKHDGLSIVSGTGSWIAEPDSAPGIIEVPFPIPDFAERRASWLASVAPAVLPADDAAALADRFRFTHDQIAGAVRAARNQARWRSARASDAASAALIDEASPADLFAAARAQTGHQLAALAQRVETKHTWQDIVLPADAVAQLKELCQRVAQRHRVLGQWGFDRKLSLGKGVNALFVGPSGTGKTMAAGIIANDIGLDLYRIDLAAVVSKYIGETEKNVDRIFTAAGTANAVLMFDEAEALFGKRSEVRDAHDRYANIEIAYLLQKMEQYDGIAILATNLRQNLDESFVRRLAFTIHFPFPDQADRARIWAATWPPETPWREDLDFERLGRQFKLSGGNIRNIALAAAFLAAADGGVVTMAHVLHATEREYQKLGKAMSATDVYRTADRTT